MIELYLPVCFTTPRAKGLLRLLTNLLSFYHQFVAFRKSQPLNLLWSGQQLPNINAHVNAIAIIMSSDFNGAVLKVSTQTPFVLMVTCNY